MKFLLVAVNAKYIHSNPAIYSLRAYAEHKEPALVGQTELAEYTINCDPGDILADLYQKKPDVIGFSCYIWNWKMIRTLVREIHKLFPALPIWLGGPEVSYEPQSVMETLPMLTGIMVGEGEQTFLELMRYYAGLSGAALGDIAGLCGGAALGDIAGLYLPGGATAPRNVTDMSEIPFYFRDPEQFEGRIIYYESSRGCPFRCSYCLSSVDRQLRFRELSTVKKELQFFLDHRAAQVKFVDRTFNCDHDHAMQIWRYLKEHDNGVTNFHFEIEADLLTEEELAFLHTLRPGLVQMEIGVQSVNPETLREIRRHVNMDHLQGAVAAIAGGHNIHVHLDLIAGLPFEDYASFAHSFNKVYEMRPQMLQLGFLKVLKGSHMYEMTGEYGMEYLSDPPYEVLYTKWLSYGDIIRLKKIEKMVELYYNSGQYTHVLPVLEKQFASPFALYEALADYYEEQGFYTNSPSRAYRYEALLQFAVSHDPQGEDIYRECLTFDMYLRENLKARAGFMKNLGPYRETIRKFYEAEEREPALLKDYAGYTAKQLQKMTHVEVFTYPARPVFVLFDYRVRDPLNGDAKVTVLSDQT